MEPNAFELKDMADPEIGADQADPVPSSDEDPRRAESLRSFAEGDYIIELNNVHKTYLLGLEGVPALRGVSLTVGRGEFISIFGTSGGGKTSMLNIIGTIDKPTKGDLSLCGTRVTERTSDRVLANLRLHKLGFVFQTFNLLSSLTALENVEMPMILAGRLSRKQRRQRAKKLLDRVGMGKRLDHLPSQLSGGEQQRVTIARALANEPSILLLDEPTGDLDSVNTAIVMKLLLELNSEGITLVMVTHDMGLKCFADRIIWMRDGKIARVEIVSEEKQAEVREELEQQLRDHGITDIAQTAPSLVRDAAGSDAPAAAPAAPAVMLSSTYIRQPRDYKTYSARVELEVVSGVATAKDKIPVR